MKQFAKNLIKLVKNEKGGIVHVLDTPENLAIDNPSKQEGYIKMVQFSSRVSDTGYINESNRYFTYFGKVQGLLNFVDERVDENDKLPGRIIIKEFRESEVPDAYKRLFYNHKAEEPESYFVKRPGKGGPVLYNSGERIMRFPVWFEYQTENAFDVFLPHDNSNEVKVWLEENAEKVDEGVLPKE